jgi:hypothetical protein
MENMTVIAFPESPRLKRLREILLVAQLRMDEANRIQEEINALMFEYDLLQLEIAPYEVAKLAKHFRLPEQMEFNF